MQLELLAGVGEREHRVVQLERDARVGQGHDAEAQPRAAAREAQRLERVGVDRRGTYPLDPHRRSASDCQRAFDVERLVPLGVVKG